MELENQPQEYLAKKEMDDERTEQLFEWVANAIVEIALRECNEQNKKVNRAKSVKTINSH